MAEVIYILMAIVSIWGICAVIIEIKDRRGKKAIKQALKDAGYV